MSKVLGWERGPCALVVELSIVERCVPVGMFWQIQSDILDSKLGILQK